MANDVNQSLDDVIGLLEREIERLKVSLDNYRLSSHPQRDSLVRFYVRAVDERQDVLDRLKEMQAGRTDTDAVH